MLILSRKLNDAILIGEDIQIKVVKIRGNVISLGIEAPQGVKIMRSELIERIEREEAAMLRCSSGTSSPIPLCSGEGKTCGKATGSGPDTMLIAS